MQDAFVRHEDGHVTLHSVGMKEEMRAKNMLGQSHSGPTRQLQSTILQHQKACLSHARAVSSSLLFFLMGLDYIWLFVFKLESSGSQSQITSVLWLLKKAVVRDTGFWQLNLILPWWNVANVCLGSNNLVKACPTLRQSDIQIYIIRKQVRYDEYAPSVVSV